MILILLFSALLMQAQQHAGTPQIHETRSRIPVSGDPVVNSSVSKAPPSLPAGARNGPGIAEVETGDWEKARWTHPMLRVPGAAQTFVSVTAPSTLLIKASWQSSSNINVNVLKGSSVLASLTSKKRFDGRTDATATVKVPTAGNILIQAKNSDSTPVNVQLYIGIVAGTR
jgi:hypothetical protein